MKQMTRRTAIPLLAALSSFFFLAFSKPGGDVFEVYIGQTMVIQQALHNDPAVKQITLTSAHYGEKMSVRFSHCGVSGKKRVITLKDENDKVLKQLNFTEAKTNRSVMSFEIREIMDLQSRGNKTIRLYYSSEELPAGKCLVSLTREGESS